MFCATSEPLLRLPPLPGVPLPQPLFYPANSSLLVLTLRPSLRCSFWWPPYPQHGRISLSYQVSILALLLERNCVSHLSRPLDAELRGAGAPSDLWVCSAQCRDWHPVGARRLVNETQEGRGSDQPLLSCYLKPGPGLTTFTSFPRWPGDQGVEAQRGPDWVWCWCARGSPWSLKAPPWLVCTCHPILHPTQTCVGPQGLAPVQHSCSQAVEPRVNDFGFLGLTCLLCEMGTLSAPAESP